MKARRALGDTHNFGRRVTARGERVAKPRTLLWEWLLLGKDSPLRAVFEAAAREEGEPERAFSFLPSLRFSLRRGEVDRVELAPLRSSSAATRRALADVFGRALALFTWLGVADLHWENLALGIDATGRVAFGPLDIEMIFGDMASPVESKLLPDPDPEVAEVCRHAAGARRLLPYLGKPVRPEDLVIILSSYADALDFLDRHAREITRAFTFVPEIRDTPIRVCLRGTDEYVRARTEPVWPPLLDAETEQLSRGDIPYFFRTLGSSGIHYYVEPTLREVGTLPRRGDVPRLAPLLSLARGLRSPSRAALREQGLFTILGAFDDPGFAGVFRHRDVQVEFRPRRLVVTTPAAELVARRDLSSYVGSVYLPCRCGEVRQVFVPPVTRCVGYVHRSQ